MALNNRSFTRLATRFNRLHVKLSAFKQDAGDYGDYQASPLMVITLPPGQTANALEIHDYLGNTLSSIDQNGMTQTPDLAQATTTITSAQLLALFTTAINVVPAPGANKVLEFISGSISYVFGATAYTVGTSTNLSIKLKDKTGADVSTTRATTGFIDQVVNEYSLFRPLTAQLVLDANAINQPLCLALLVANPTLGDGTLKVNVIYRTHTLV